MCDSSIRPHAGVMLVIAKVSAHVRPTPLHSGVLPRRTRQVTERHAKLRAMTTTSVLSDVSFVAVNIHARDSAFGCKLHAHTPAAALIPQLRDQFLARCEGNDPLRDYLTAERVEWALEYGPIRERIDPESTLDEAGITPGTDLYLTRRTRTENYPVLRDDVAEGAAEVSKRVFTVIDGRDTRRMGALALPFAVTAASLVGVADVLSADRGQRWLVVAALAALAVMCASVASVLTRARSGYGDVSTALSVSAYIATAAAAVAGVPRAPGVWHLTTVGAAVATMVVLLWAVTGNRPAALHTGVATAAVSAVAVGLLHTVIPVSSQAVAAQLMFLSVAVMVWGTQIARLVGQVRVNYIPTTGEPLVRREDMSVHEVSKRSTSASAIEAMLNQENQVITTLQALIGMLTAAAVTLVASAGVAGYFTRNYEWHMFASVAAATVAAVAIGRGMVVRAAAVPLMVGGPLAATAYLLGRALSPHHVDITVLAAGLVPLLVFVLLSSIWAVRAQKLHSPLGKRRLELAATAAVVTMFPLLVLIMEGWSKVRNR